MPRRIPRPSTDLLLAMALLPVMAGLVVGGCSRVGNGAPTPAPPPTSAPNQFALVHAALCDSVQAAEAGDVATAEAKFADAHAGLHDLAAVASEEVEDRALAARLLEAKRHVEEAGAGVGAPELRALSAAAADAIEAIGGAAPPDCG